MKNTSSTRRMSTIGAIWNSGSSSGGFFLSCSRFCLMVCLCTRGWGLFRPIECGAAMRAGILSRHDEAVAVGAFRREHFRRASRVARFERRGRRSGVLPAAPAFSPTWTTCNWSKGISTMSWLIMSSAWHDDHLRAVAENVIEDERRDGNEKAACRGHEHFANARGKAARIGDAACAQVWQRRPSCQ